MDLPVWAWFGPTDDAETSLAHQAGEADAPTGGANPPSKVLMPHRGRIGEDDWLLVLKLGCMAMRRSTDRLTRRHLDLRFGTFARLHCASAVSFHHCRLCLVDLRLIRFSAFAHHAWARTIPV